MPRPRTLSDEAILAEVLRLVLKIGPSEFTLAAAGKQIGLSPSTLVQRFGSKRALLLAADRWGVERWVSALDEVPEGGSVLDRLVAGLVRSADPEMTADEMANSVSLLQIGLSDSEFHGSTKAGAIRWREKVHARLRAAVANAELRPDIDLDTLAVLVEVTYHGAMIHWAIHREGDLGASLETRFTQLLQPYRT